MIGLAVAGVGIVLVVVALVVLFGPWAAVVCGVVLIAAGVVVDWEEVARDKHPGAPHPWRER